MGTKHRKDANAQGDEGAIVTRGVGTVLYYAERMRPMTFICLSFLYKRLGMCANDK